MVQRNSNKNAERGNNMESTNFLPQKSGRGTGPSSKPIYQN